MIIGRTLQNMNNIINIEVNANCNLSIQQINLLSKRKATLSLARDLKFRELIDSGARFLKQEFSKGQSIYGVTTGYGESCNRKIPLEFIEELPPALIRFHGCGLGDFLTIEQTRAVLVVRLVSLCRGYSGVSFELLEMLETLINKDILPVIPSEGSVGASGDLTPLSYVAAVIIGERRVWYKGEIRSTADVFKELSIHAIKLRPKEALALMNGTTVMTALAVEVFSRAEYLVSFAARLTSMTSLALLGNPEHFNKCLFTAKPHPGQAKVAAYIAEDLKNIIFNKTTGRLQDRYSTRCAPHIIGVLADFLPIFKNTIEIEINSANDNPLVDVSDSSDIKILHGGHFYGGHIAFVMDGIKILIANIADLMDRQLASLVDSKFNNGLTENLSGANKVRIVINHGLKAVQIGASAWAAEALKHTMPASVFSRSTESHNQDKVSMGTIAARDALRILQLTEQVAAAQLLAALQALRLRERDKTINVENYTAKFSAFLTEAKKSIPFVQEDQELDECLRGLIINIQQQRWVLYDEIMS